MGLLNIIWIIIFLVLGVGLTVQAFDTINFGAWDNIFGFFMILVALFGIYCMTKDTSPFVMRMRSKYGPVKRRLEAKIADILRFVSLGHTVGVQAEDREMHRPQPMKMEEERFASVSIQQKRSPSARAGRRHRVEPPKMHNVKGHSDLNQPAPRKEPPGPAGNMTPQRKRPSARVTSASEQPAVQRKESELLQAAENAPDNYLESLEEILREVDTAPGSAGGTNEKPDADEINLDNFLK